MSKQEFFEGTPIRIAFTLRNAEQGKDILDHLVEERLVAGGTIIQAESQNWVGGEILEQERKEFTAYTTLEKLPLIRRRLELLYGECAPILSQYVMTNEQRSVRGWIERNTRE